MALSLHDARGRRTRPAHQPESSHKPRRRKPAAQYGATERCRPPVLRLPSRTRERRATGWWCGDRPRRDGGTEKRLKRRPKRKAHRSDGGRADQQGPRLRHKDRAVKRDEIRIFTSGRSVDFLTIHRPAWKRAPAGIGSAGFCGKESICAQRIQKLYI